MSYFYVLVGQTPVPVPDVQAWSEWFETADRHVALTRLPWASVSTIFLGVDFGLASQPNLFETIVFWDFEGGGNELERSSSWSDAEAVHALLVGEALRPQAVLAWLLRLAWESVDNAVSAWRWEVWGNA